MSESKKRKPLRGVEARNAIVEQNLGLVHWYVNKVALHYRLIPKDDLLQAGFMGLMRAAELWDEAKTVKFSTYALDWIKSFIKRAANEDRTVHIPEHRLRGCKPGVSRMGRAYSIDDLKFDCRSDGSSGSNGGGGGRAIWCVEVEKSWVSACEAAEDREDARVVCNDLKSVLHQQERDVIEGRFTEGKTLDELAVRLGLSRERIRQIEVKALARMRKFATRRERQKELENEQHRQAGSQAETTGGTQATTGTTSPQGTDRSQGEGDLPNTRK